MSGAPERTGGIYRAAHGLLKDLAFTMAVILVLTGSLYLYAGVWPPLVSVDGTSMYPHLKSGDLVLLRGLDRVNVTTADKAIGEGYKKFNGYGDVIVYVPLGDSSRVPVIHRAVYWVEQGRPMWPNGPPAPWSGYITLGDNNYFYDQSSSVSPDAPVKPQWVIGVPQLSIPYLGMLRSLL